MFDGPVHFADRCGACGADFSGQNVGDGPAAFVTMIIGAVVIALAMLVEVWLHPPFLVHVLIWVPFTVAAILGGLRAAKGALFHAEWHRHAREGKLAAEEFDDE